MKFSAFALLSTLALAASAHGQAIPADAAAPAAGNEDAMVVTVDARTGKLRPATDAEIAALSAAAAAQPSGRVSSAARRSWDSMPQTASEAAATMRTRRGKGMAMRVPQSAMSSWTATVDAEGRVLVDEGGNGAAAQATEVSE